jgi:hypothetical protein
MKAITLWQPWASLLACGAKKYETRSWATSYRGPIAIHAGKLYLNQFEEQFGDTAHKALKEAAPGFTFMHALPRGAVIATAELVGCWEMLINPYDGVIHFLDETDAAICPDRSELLFGDWEPGRFAWEFANMKMLPEPIPAKGAQGLWNWEVSK